MSNKVNRQGPQTVWGRAGGEPESSALHDSRLNPNVWTGNTPPLRAAGDEETNLLQVQCHCRSVIGVLWSVNRRTRTGLPNLLFLHAQVIEDATGGPRCMRVVQNVVAAEVQLVSDCPVHGRQNIDGALLANKGAEAETRIAEGYEKIGLLVLPRTPRLH